MSKKILIITGDAGESYETLYAIHRFRVAGNDQLSRCIEICRRHDLPLRDLGAHGSNLGVVTTNDGRHRPDARRHSRLHQPSALGDQRRRVMQRQCAGTDQCAVLAKAVTGQLRWLRPTQLLPDPPHRHAGRQQRRLGVFGAIKLLCRAVLTQLPQVHASALCSFVESSAYHGMCSGQLGQHAHGLRALPGENKRQR